MSGFLNILLNVMNNRQREKELAANQPFQAAQLKHLELQNTADQNNLSDLAAIRQASSDASRGEAKFVPAQGAKLSESSNVFNTPGTTQTIKGDPIEAGMRKAIELGRPDLAGNYKQVIDLNDTLNTMAARNKTWGGSEQYYQLKSQLETASQAGDLLNKLHRSGGMPMVKRVVEANPELQKIVGDPETLTFNQEGVMHPALHAQTGQPIPNWFYMVDNEGKTKMVEIKSQEEWSQPYVMSVGGKRGLVQRSSSGQIKPVMQDVSTTVVVRGGKDDENPVAQSTFVDPETGKPLVFDKKTGSYRVANVQGGVAPKPSAMTPEAAAKTQLVEQALSYMPQIKGLYLDNQGRVDRTNVFNAMTRTPNTQGRQASTLILDAMEAKLRAESGAAVPEPEVKRMAKRYMPSPLDDDTTIKMKLDNLEKYLKGSTSKMNVGRGGSSPKRPPKQNKQAIVDDLRSEFNIGKK